MDIPFIYVPNVELLVYKKNYSLDWADLTNDLFNPIRVKLLYMIGRSFVILYNWEIFSNFNENLVILIRTCLGVINCGVLYLLIILWYDKSVNESFHTIMTCTDKKY